MIDKFLSVKQVKTNNNNNNNNHNNNNNNNNNKKKKKKKNNNNNNKNNNNKTLHSRDDIDNMYQEKKVEEKLSLLRVFLGINTSTLWVL